LKEAEAGVAIHNFGSSALAPQYYTEFDSLFVSFTGFRYNLGFSGSYYRTGGYYENQGDDELVALRELTQAKCINQSN
jgi:hypothetical protein